MTNSETKMVQADDGYDSDEYAITNEIVIIEEH